MLINKAFTFITPSTVSSENVFLFQDFNIGYNIYNVCNVFFTNLQQHYHASGTNTPLKRYQYLEKRRQ